jgi:glycosyltransferase involved in cell wall biosynthesis
VSRLLFDVSRLLLRGPRASPTGIDRVTLAYARWLRSRDDIALKPVWGLGGALAAMSPGQFKRLSDRSLRGVSSPDRAESPAWRALQQALLEPDASARPLRSEGRPGVPLRTAAWYADAAWRAPTLLAGLSPATAGSTYLNVSHFGLENPGFQGRLAARGVRLAVMIHDLIPIRHPEFCSPGAAARHAERVQGALRHARLIIANSQATADDLRAYAVECALPAPAIQVAPLGVEDAFRRDAPALRAGRPYFVCVGTIEPRKNLVFLLTLWRRLAERLGEDTPRLVLVGRRGWENEAVLDHLQRSPPILRWTHEVSDLSDEELARLIAGSAALLAPSLTEGFDFTTLEALALGAPVIASRIPAHCELARGATLVDPLDGPAWLEAIEAARTSHKRPPPFAPPTWAQHFAIARDALGEVQAGA